MSKTPRTDALDRRLGGFEAFKALAAELETELAAANKSRDDWCELVNQLRAEVKRLEDQLEAWYANK